MHNEKGRRPYDERSVDRRGGSYRASDFYPRFGAAGSRHATECERNRTDSYAEANGFCDPCASPAACSPLGKESRGWFFRGPAEPARAFYHTEQESKPDEPDACRRQGDLGDSDALSASLIGVYRPPAILQDLIAFQPMDRGRRVARRNFTSGRSQNRA
jgi:hypothetical protein